MKQFILSILVIGGLSVNGQSLKDALYSGKLKTDTGTVIRKGDDLSSKIDTARKKPVEPEKMKVAAGNRDSLGNSTGFNAAGDSANNPVGVTPENIPSNGNATSSGDAPKDNNKLWKEFADSLSSTIKTEVLPSKKIKAGTYYVLVEYEIGADGQVTTNNVSASPESSYLVQQVKERITLTAPQLLPVVSNGKARKVLKKYTMIITKS